MLAARCTITPRMHINIYVDCAWNSKAREARRLMSVRSRVRVCNSNCNATAVASNYTCVRQCFEPVVYVGGVVHARARAIDRAFYVLGSAIEHSFAIIRRRGARDTHAPHVVQSESVMWLLCWSLSVVLCASKFQKSIRDIRRISSHHNKHHIICALCASTHVGVYVVAYTHVSAVYAGKPPIIKPHILLKTHGKRLAGPASFRRVCICHVV